MIQLSYVQFFSWFALFAMWIYTTPAVTKHIYGTTDTTSLDYNIGADWVGILMSTYNGISALAAFLLVWMANRMQRKYVHSISLVLGGIGLSTFYIFKSPELLLISEIGIGVAWASILSIPYAILTGSLPQKKLGIYMGIFNFFIVIPQITAAAILGFMVKSIFGGDAIYALLLGGLSMFVAAVIMLKVEDLN
jgi:maltose/moltooligosaccharide transporter